MRAVLSETFDFGTYERSQPCKTKKSRAVRPSEIETLVLDFMKALITYGIKVK